MKEFQPGGAESSKEIIEDVKSQLTAYGEKMRLRGLEGRVQRGLDPAAMLALKQTREKLAKVAEVFGADMDELDQLTAKLHVGAIWDYADDLAKAENPEIKSWMVAGEACVADKETEGDLSEEEFLNDMKRVNKLLDDAAKGPEEFFKRAKENLVSRSSEKFRLEDGIPVSELDDGFLAAALNGHKSAIVKDKDGLLFVGAKKLDYDVLEDAGLKSQTREDRGREATFYQDESGKDVVKVLYPGFCIVFNEDLDTAKKLAKTAGQEKEAE